VKHKLRRFVLLATQNTPLETFARRIYYVLAQNKGARYDKETSKVMRKILKRDSNCIDIGAYRGDILREMLKIAPQGKVFAFEPIPENYQYISRKYTSAITYNIALSDRAGKSVFYHATGRPARSGLRKQSYPNPNEKVEEITISVDKLDNVIPNDTKIDFIKVDVEGAELLVLRGGEQLLKKSKPMVLFEHEPDLARKFGTTTEQLYEFLSNQCRLNISLMKRWLSGEKPYSREEFLNSASSKDEFCFIAY
jgi:FkbM family methyltransferase